MKKAIILIFAFAVFLACSSDDKNETNIRIFNASAFDFKNITVGSTNFDNLGAGQTSDYKVFVGAYRYNYVELDIDSETYIIQPIDYVGEIPLENGDYTYRLDANDSQEQYGKLSISLIED